MAGEKFVWIVMYRGEVAEVYDNEAAADEHAKRDEHWYSIEGYEVFSEVQPE